MYVYFEDAELNIICHAKCVEFLCHIVRDRRITRNVIPEDNDVPRYISVSSFVKGFDTAKRSDKVTLSPPVRASCNHRAVITEHRKYLNRVTNARINHDPTSARVSFFIRVIFQSLFAIYLLVYFS